MKYERFEDLPVWKAAIELAERVFALVEDRHFGGRGDLRSQLQRAALSVSNNVAEGFERGTTQELLTFIYIARGSAGETRSMLCFCERLHFLAHLKSQISNLKSLAGNIARQLRGWADSLQNSNVKGQRYLNNRSRALDEHERRGAAFWARLEEQHAARLGAVGDGRPGSADCSNGTPTDANAISPTDEKIGNLTAMHATYEGAR